MRYLVPQAVIILATLAWLGGHMTEHTYLQVLCVAHLAIPIWAAWLAPRGQNALAILLGPGLVIGLHVLAIAFAWLQLIGSNPEDHWLGRMVLILWTLAVAAYTVYCMIAYAVVARLAQRAR